MSRNKFPTPDATGRERLRGNTGIRAVKITAIEVAVARRYRTPKVARVAVAIARPLASGIQIVTLRRTVTAATVVTNPKGILLNIALLRSSNISVFRFNYLAKKLLAPRRLNHPRRVERCTLRIPLSNQTPACSKKDISTTLFILKPCHIFI